MYKGVINTDSLNVRKDGPWKKGPILGVLDFGDEVEIEFATFGETVQGDNKWYCLTDGSFIWSGYVDADSGAIPRREYVAHKKYVIFTADDYGVVDSINKGIENAVSSGLLNSVTCLTNYGTNGLKSLANIRTLQRCAVTEIPLELGVHLTISSGSPLIGRNDAHYLCRPTRKKPKHYPESDFYDYTKVRGAFRKAYLKGKRAEFLEQLYNELKAQIEVFTNPKDGGAPIPVAHLTSHHNSLLYETEFFEVMLRLSNEFRQNDRPVPIRSLENLPGWKDWGFLRFKGKVPFPSGRIHRLKQELNSGTNKAIETPSLLHSDHYGPPPFVEKRSESINSLKNKKLDKAEGILNDLEKRNAKSMEFLLHLRDGKILTHEQYEELESRPKGYAGINPLAFDARKAEYLSFMERFHQAKHNLNKDEIEIREGKMYLGSWKNL